MTRILQRILSIFFYFLFVGFFVLIFPFHFILLQRRLKWTHNLSHRLNMAWGWVIMSPVGVWLKPINRKALDPQRHYIFAANHTSYLDIPICNVSIRHSFRFIGKAELNSLPLFGYMFKRLHIPVNRGSVTDAFKSFKYARKKLEEGTSILIFPEATIPDKTQVTLKRFKDGAFRMAIETGTPLVPVTILGGDIAMPDNGKFLIRPQIVKVVFHEPIETQGMDVSEAGKLRDQVYDLMFGTLVKEGYGRGNQLPDKG
jgi:1-acyl-sn-glycerol-3-phosphate acyltransferase